MNSRPKRLITKNAATKARTTFCPFPLLLLLSPVGAVGSAVEKASAPYFGTIATPDEYFDQTGSTCATARCAHPTQSSVG
jgi:hypothetical protein